jgi:hypothetical protein
MTGIRTRSHENRCNGWPLLPDSPASSNRERGTARPRRRRSRSSRSGRVRKSPIASSERSTMTLSASAVSFMVVGYRHHFERYRLAVHLKTARSPFRLRAATVPATGSIRPGRIRLRWRSFLVRPLRCRRWLPPRRTFGRWGGRTDAVNDRHVEARSGSGCPGLSFAEPLGNDPRPFHRMTSRPQLRQGVRRSKPAHVQQPQVIVILGGRSHGRARVANAAVLLTNSRLPGQMPSLDSRWFRLLSIRSGNWPRVGPRATRRIERSAAVPRR